MEPIDPTDLSDIPPGIVLDTWRQIDEEIRRRLLKNWVSPYPQEEEDRIWRKRGYVARNPTQPKMYLTWVVSPGAITHEDPGPAIKVFLFDEITTYELEAPGFFFGEYHRALNLFKRDAPPFTLEVAFAEIDRIIQALLCGEWPKPTT